MGQEWLGPSYFFISLVVGPLNSLVWYVLPQGIYGVWLLFFVSARTNKRHHHQKPVPKAGPTGSVRQAQGVPKPKPTSGDGMQAARPHGLALVWLLLPWEVYSALRMVGVRDGPPIITRAFRLVDQGRAVLEFGAHLKGIGWHQLGRRP